MKLQAGLLQSSPAYLLSQPDNGSYGVYTDASTVATTRLSANSTSFFIVRHGDLQAQSNASYKLKLPTSRGNLTIPQLGGSLSLNGRDSKIHVMDYDVGGINLVYSSAEVFTWKKSGKKSVLVLYGGQNETHEFSVERSLGLPSNIEGQGVKVRRVASGIAVHWKVEPTRRVVYFGEDLEVHLLWRNEAYDYWVLDLPAPAPVGRYSSPSRANNSVIVKGGYLLRTAEISGNRLTLTGDVNATTEIELVAGPPSISEIYFNGRRVRTASSNGRLHGNVTFHDPKLKLPDFTTQKWSYVNSLPEVEESYDDRQWVVCNKTTPANIRNLTTPTSLYASDYGFNGGSLFYRGTFTANGSETSLYLLTEGGFAYGHSVWLNSTNIGVWEGVSTEMFYNQTLALKDLKAGETYVLSVLIDHMGNDENFPANVYTMRDPRGIIDYTLHGREKETISWKITGNLGGEQYQDHSRGPLNEGGIYAERQGYHLPGAPVQQWETRSPFSDIAPLGVGFYATSFDLRMPLGYDIPLSVVFTNTTGQDSSPARFRSEIFVNGWQFGKYGMFDCSLDPLLNFANSLTSFTLDTS